MEDLAKNVGGWSTHLIVNVIPISAYIAAPQFDARPCVTPHLRVCP